MSRETQSTIAEYIRDDLRSRVESGRIPDDLTLHGLSRTYDVSITPVRQALQAPVRQTAGRMMPYRSSVFISGSPAGARTV